MSDRLPLSALLSKALVAFTIEFDNEFEHRTPHRTSKRGSRTDPWLVSMVFWLKLMRFVPPDGITIRDLTRRTGKRERRFLLTRMGKWWGYIKIDRSGESPADWIIYPTPGGQNAIAQWSPLNGEMEERWRQRFGKPQVDRLYESLQTIVTRLDPLPDTLPILGYPLRCEVTEVGRSPSADLCLPTLLSKALLAFALEFESTTDLSLAVCENVLRIVDEDGIKLRDMPRLSGVSKEALAMAIDRLEKKGLIETELEVPGKRTKRLVLTNAGIEAKTGYQQSMQEIESRWTAQFSDSLRKALEELVSGPEMMEGIRPYPDNWRASAPAREVLPHFPMVLHRGGYPDGS